MRKAVVLFSGGLDSALAAKLMQEQGVEVHLVNFLTIFCSKSEEEAKLRQAERTAAELGLGLKTFEVTKEVLDIVKKPKYGYGKNLNPCIDCRIFTFKKAKQYMQEIGASFIVTGEVLGERPMSQHRKAIEIIEKESGLSGLIVRPLSAKLLPPSVPEEKGWVDRDRLLSLQGRGRSQQMALARKYAIKDYATPSGGCLLTDKGFSKKLKDLIERGDFDLTDLLFLKLGRHFRLADSVKLVTGRDDAENTKLTALAQKGDYIFDAESLPGAISIYKGEFDQKLAQKAAEITARYTDSNGKAIQINYWQTPDGLMKSLNVTPASEETLSRHRIGDGSECNLGPGTHYIGDLSPKR